MQNARLGVLSVLLGIGSSGFVRVGMPAPEDLPPTLLDRPVCPDVGSRLEIFVDYFLVDRLRGARLKLHHPRPAEVVIRKDRPWEGEHGFGQDVILDGDRYLMYYHSGGRMCYAESRDGVHWTKPSLGLIKVDGSRENNLVGTADGQELYEHRIEPSARFFLDRRLGVPAGERFKGLKLNEGKRANPTLEDEARKFTLDDRGLWLGSPTDVIAFVSGDGKVWSKLR